MNKYLADIFQDKAIVDKIQNRLPYLFKIAELECSRAGKIGMQVGSLRESIIAALLIFRFGEPNVETGIPITEPEIDVKLFGQPISIKTMTGTNFAGMKLSWTVDAASARAFSESYYPSCDILFTQIAWGSRGGFHYIPVEAQTALFDKIGREAYIRLPKEDTNPRGVEISALALRNLLVHEVTKSIGISWGNPIIDYRPYERWLDYWSKE